MLKKSKVGGAALAADPLPSVPASLGVPIPSGPEPPFARQHLCHGERHSQRRRGGGLGRRLHGLQEPSGYLAASAVTGMHVNVT